MCSIIRQLLVRRQIYLQVNASYAIAGSEWRLVFPTHKNTNKNPKVAVLWSITQFKYKSDLYSGKTTTSWHIIFPSAARSAA